jgi:hypothetical protein
LILIGRSSSLREKYCTRTDRGESEQNCSLSSRAAFIYNESFVQTVANRDEQDDQEYCRSLCE